MKPDESALRSNYKSFVERINKVSSPADAEKLSQSLERLWQNGIFTKREFGMLDCLLIEKTSSLT